MGPEVKLPESVNSCEAKLQVFVCTIGGCDQLFLTLKLLLEIAEAIENATNCDVCALVCRYLGIFWKRGRFTVLSTQFISTYHLIQIYGRTEIPQWRGPSPENWKFVPIKYFFN